MAGRNATQPLLRALVMGMGRTQGMTAAAAAPQRRARQLHGTPTVRAGIPTVTQKTGFGWARVDIFSRLLQDRILCVMGPVNEWMSRVVVAQLLNLEAADPKKPIAMYIQSPGGRVDMGLAIYDTMQYIEPPISTVCMGDACSMGSLLLAAGDKGHRYSLPNARIMVHQPSGGVGGDATDVSIQAEHMLETKRILNEIYVQHTGQSYDAIETALDRDNFMSPTEALEFGLIDAIVEKRELPPADE